MNYYRRIKQACKMNDRFEILDREDDFEKFAIKISKAEIVISTRLHLFMISSFL
jgi:polysaccharide pyruvyl transferase WcaK-like protein